MATPPAGGCLLSLSASESVNGGAILVEIKRNPTRAVKIGSITVGAGHPIATQSMTATHTQDVEATLAQVEDLRKAGAGVVRIAVDSKKDA
ncbi:hypothetical protein EBR56_07180, partial [bacterium]|nr:hypothetical protein [bacterium]